jgi:PBP1b-binding outer membrane lipoprotein LpoB
MSARRCGAAAVLAAALLATGCGKSEAPKVDAAAEKAAATERAKQRAYGGTEVKALEDAKKLEADMNEKAKARDPDSK